MIIDQIVDDGDTYYSESYELHHTDDRKTLNVLDFKGDLIIQKTHRAHVTIEEPAYAGTFRSKNPTNMHVVKALELFFNRYNAGVLVSPVLNIAIWRDAKYFNIFDGQARRDNLSPTDDPSGAAKLILVRDMTGVLFVILEKSGVKNENFVIYQIGIRGLQKLLAFDDDLEEPEKSVGKPQRRPSGYIIQDQFRALVRGSFHLNHELVPSELRGRGHLIVALAALIYSRLVPANKWTSAMIDLIFNQSHIYLVDLARVLEKKLDESFELKIEDVMGDVILGPYAAKINVLINVIPGIAKKGKATIDTGLRDFFKTNHLAILEIKKTFYAVWHDSEKFYFFDPFACDHEGFRVDSADPENVDKYKKALACVTMNSSVNQLIETILENTGNKEKDPFILHGFVLLYVKTGSTPDGPLDSVIYRDKKTNRRPLPPVGPKPEEPDDCKIVMDMVPRIRQNASRTKDAFSQYPDLMKRVEAYMMREDEPTTFVEDLPENVGDSESPEESNANLHLSEETEDDDKKVHFEDEEARQTSTETETNKDEKVRGEVIAEPIQESVFIRPVIRSTPDEIKYIKGYNIINPHRLILHGSNNSLAENFEEKYRGRQGLAMALTAIAYAKIKNPETWRNVDVDQILRVGGRAHADIITWIRQGSPADAEEVEKGEEGEESEDEEKDEEDEDEEDEEEGETQDEEEKDEDSLTMKSFKGALKPTPSHLQISMLPTKMKLGDNKVTFKKRQSLMEGNADPLANLGEALKRFFEIYNEAILENKRLMYGIWKQDDKFFLLNPYGSDEEGWRCRDYPASLVITDTLDELIHLLHTILEFNDRTFSIHFVAVESIQPGDKYIPPVPLQVPEDDAMQKYETKFLPVTDEDIFVPETETDTQAQVAPEEEKKPAKDKDDEDDEDDEDDDDDEEDNEEDAEEPEEEETAEEPVPEPEKPLVDPLLEVEEQEFPDPPERVNLSLVTGSVKMLDEVIPDSELVETVMYERLKYSHPPPYVLPPKKVLCILLEAKKASGSMHSLLSRFSIDSKLAVKAATDLPVGKDTDPATMAVVSSTDEGKASKVIKLPPKKYLFSRIPSIGFTPLRAINDMFIQDEDVDRQMEEECRRAKALEPPAELVLQEVPEDPIGIRIRPEIIPLGPPIKTPTPKKKPKPCPEHSTVRPCKISEADKADAMLRKILCDTEDVLFDMIFPKKEEPVDIDDLEDPPSNEQDAVQDPEASSVAATIDDEEAASVAQTNDNEGVPKKQEEPETRGFLRAEKNVGIIEANMALKDRELIAPCHLRECFFAAMLCILAKVRTNVNDFRGTILDQFIVAADKIHRRIGKIRYKLLRRFKNVVVLGMKCNVVVKQMFYADPENCAADELSFMLDTYMNKNKSGILVLESASYAFWSSSDKYYLFDPYACDDKGKANKAGAACLLEFCDYDQFIKRIHENNGAKADSPYRIYNLSIAHAEPVKTRKKLKKKRKKRCPKTMSDETIAEASPDDSPDESYETKRELSLLELPEWVDKGEPVNQFDLTIPSYATIKHYDASALEVPVVENDITRPLLAPFKKIKPGEESLVDPLDPPRKKLYDRRFKEQTCVGEPIDLCIIAWSCVHDPISWSVRTIRGIYEAAKDLTFDSLLTATDTNPGEMIDGVLTEFAIANYYFQAVFTPLHHGKLYALVGWNLATSIKKLLEIPIYSGAILICEKAHIGIMKKGQNHFAWWTVPNTKNLRIVTSRSLEEFLKLVIKAINTTEEKEFVMRIVTISYARKLDPDCSDMLGLHESAVPAASLGQIHRKKSPPYDLQAIFRPTLPNSKPIFVLGTVALEGRNIVTEPRVKRCYYVAVLSVMIKRDIVQSPMPAMIDRVIEVADGLYREFDEAKYHTEHILRNVTLMNRIFDFRDRASSLNLFKIHPLTGKTDFFSVVRKQVRKHFIKHTDGLIQFTNCAYGFWYCRGTNAYYYIDPYPCNVRGRKVEDGGAGCLCAFSSICQMVKQWCVNRYQLTTGFFIHRINVESINVPPYDKFSEDPMWVYLDYQWCFEHSIMSNASEKPKQKKKVTDDLCKVEKEERIKPAWNNYAIEVPSLIYSVWGTIGSYDARFGDRAGKNRDAICVAVLSMQCLCHPSRWGPAILDSAVICGDSYYTESIKSSSKKGTRYENRFNLQPCFKVYPHIWKIEFMPNICGILYGGRGRPDLATTLKIGLEDSPNLVLQCDKVSLAVLSIGTDFYVVDPCWTGPPLFAKNHGAVYGLCCRNMNSLVYAVTKMLNTNQRLEFRVTPISLSFSQEICKFADRRKLMKKEILLDPVSDEPGLADGPAIPVSGAIVRPGQDSFLYFRRDLRRGILYGPELENPTPEAPIPTMSYQVTNNYMISTTWHLNIGKERPKKRSYPPYDPAVMQRDARYCTDSKRSTIDSAEPCSMEEKIQSCDDYPRTVDFAAGKYARQSTKILTRGRIKPEVPLTQPLDCIRKRKFLMDASRREFNKWTKEMADEAYKTQQHRIPETEEKTDAESSSHLPENPDERAHDADKPIEYANEEVVL